MILVTHVDLDGAGCSIVGKIFFPNITVYHHDYDTVDEKVLTLLQETTEKILIADVSISAETATIVNEKYPNRIEIFDHHRTAQEYLQCYSWTTYDLTQCGTRILFQELKKRMPNIKIPAQLDMLTRRINDYDLWIHEFSDTKSYNDMMYMLGMDSFISVMIERLQKNQQLIQATDQFYLQGLWSTKQKYYKKVLHNAIVDGNRLIVIASRYTSELSQYIRDISPQPEAWKNVQYIDVVNIESNSHSLRSYDLNFDVSEVAKAHGGGGHPRAAGYSITNTNRDWLLSL